MEGATSSGRLLSWLAAYLISLIEVLLFYIEVLLFYIEVLLFYYLAG